MLFNEAIPKFNAWLSFGKRQSTRGTYRVQLMQFALYMHNCPIETVILDHVITYLQEMKDLGWDQNNFLAKTAALKKFFAFYNKQGITTFDPELIPIIEGEYRFPKIADPVDYLKVLAAIPQNNDPRHIRNNAMIRLVKDSGIRLSEMLSLDLEQMDTTGREMENEKGEKFIAYSAVIKTAKTKKLHPIRMVFWSEETNEALKLWLAKRKRLFQTMMKCDPDAVFISVSGVKAGSRIGKSGATEIARRLSHAAGLDYVLNFHSLRHLKGRDFAEGGAEDSSIATMLGHANVESSRPYTIMTGNKMAQFHYKHTRKPQ